MELSTGTKLGRYEILARLGAGGMGEVYRAKDTKLGRQVAIKVLPAHLWANAYARERLRREAAAVASLDHPYICKIFEIGEDGEVLFLVMELVLGQTLYQRLSAAPIRLSEAVQISSEVAEALEEAHIHRFIHRDLKPANVMLAQGHVKVMDFGVAKQSSEIAPIAVDAPTETSTGPALTELGSVIGTPDYMSPEQIRGESLDQRSDLFSFGILLCDLLGIAHPFRRPSTHETMAAILRDPPNLNGDLPQGLMLLIRRLLQKTPEDRYSSMAQVRADLAQLSSKALASERELQTSKLHEDRIPLIGRDAERKELLRRLEEALSGRGSIVMIGGEPGVGKTHLINALLDDARQSGAYVNVGNCYEMEGSPPYVPVIEMLEHTARTAPKEGFRRVLADDASEIAKLIPELRRTYPDIPEPIQLPPEQQRRYLFNAFRAYLERGAKTTPLVLIYEDLHWADEPTLLLLQHIAQILPTAAILIIGTYRDVDLEVNRPFAKTLETMLRQKQATRITLRRLQLDGVESMLAVMSGQQPPPSLARVVFAGTEGNPFFVEEVFRHLAEEGKLFDETGKWRADLRADHLQVPEGVRLVLGRRLDRLGADAKRILTAAAVIGRSFSLRLLEALENAPSDAALDAVEEAECAHLISAEPVSSRETRYRFVHELVRQTLAETLSLPRRQRLHARVADALEKLYAANLEGQASPLAHHLYQAGAAADPEKTSAYLMMAARKARASAAHEEALAHIENALSLWEGEESLRVGDLTLQKADALGSLGRLDAAIANYRTAIQLFEKASAAAKMGGASLMLASSHIWRAELAAASRTIDRALQWLGSREPELRLFLASLRISVLSVSGEVAAASSVWADLGAPENGSEVILYEGSMQFKKAAVAGRRVADSYRAKGDLWVAANDEFRRVWIAYCGQPGETAGDLPGWMQMAEKVGHHGALWAMKGQSGQLQAARGELRLAERNVEEHWNFGEAHQLAWNFMADFLRGHLAFLRGNLNEAEGWFRHRQEPQSYLFGAKDASLFALLAESNDDRSGKAWTERRWNLPKSGQLNPTGAWIALDRSVVGLAYLGRKDETAALRPLTEELVRTGVWVSFGSLAPFQTSAGIAAACAGDWAAAEQHHLTAIHQMDTAPYQVSQPVAREWYARMLSDRGGDGDRAKAIGLLREALAMYESMEMPFHAARTSGRLATL